MSEIESRVASEGVRRRVDGPAAGRVKVRRGGYVESVHRVHVVVAYADGTRHSTLGDGALATYYRSAAKPIQALPLVEDGVMERFGLDTEDLALCCASHNSEVRHVTVARRILARADVAETALVCGGHPPLRAEEGYRIMREGRRPGPIESNCSGKHAGMLALARFHGWPLEGYQRPDHPVQQRMAAEIVRWTGSEGALETGTDGCGVVCFRVPLDRIALSFARLAAGAAQGAPVARVVEAMVAHPFLVAGTGRLCTAVMEATRGAVFAKTGAEGVYAVGVPGQGLGIALKVEDGARRASEVALVRVLDALGLVGDDPGGRLTSFRRPVVHDTRGEVVGDVAAEFELGPHA